MEFDGYNIKVPLKNTKMYYYTSYSLIMHFLFMLVLKVTILEIISKVLKYMKKVVII